MKKATKRGGTGKARKKARPATPATAVADAIDGDEIRPEYDFSGGVRGKYADRFPRGQSVRVVVLAPDVAEAFTTARDVNAALRRIMKAKSPGSAVRRSHRRTA